MTWYALKIVQTSPRLPRTVVQCSAGQCHALSLPSPSFVQCIVRRGQCRGLTVWPRSADRGLGGSGPDYRDGKWHEQWHHAWDEQMDIRQFFFLTIMLT